MSVTELNRNRLKTVQQMPCPERMRLMELYSQATRELSGLVTSLSDVAFSYEMDGFDIAWEQCENARRHCSDVRKLIYSHVVEHRCALCLPQK